MRSIKGQDPIVIKLPIYGGAADIADGALIMPGATADTDLGTWIVGASTAPDAIGTLRGLHDYSVSGDSLVAGTNWVFRDVELCDRYQPLEVEYDLTDTMAVASSSGTTVTITSLEDNIDTSWLYSPVSKTLFFLVASASGSATTKTASGWTSADTAVKILRSGHQLAKLNTGATKIGTDAAAGSWTVCVLENWFEDVNRGPERLDPTKHNGITLLSPRFWSVLLVRNTAGHTTE